MKRRCFLADGEVWLGRSWVALVLAAATAVTGFAAERVVLCEEFAVIG